MSVTTGKHPGAQQLDSGSAVRGRTFPLTSVVLISSSELQLILKWGLASMHRVSELGRESPAMAASIAQAEVEVTPTSELRFAGHALRQGL